MHVVGSDGYVWNHKDTNQHRKSSDLRISSGEEIEIEYFPSMRQVKVTNISSKKEHILNNITDDEQDLHFAIETYR